MRHIKKYAIPASILLSIFAIILSACASMTKPTTVHGQLSYAITTHEAVTTTVTELLRSDQITVEKAKSLRLDLVKAKEHITSAVEYLLDGDLFNTENRLQLASVLLLSLQARLRENEQ